MQDERPEAHAAADWSVHAERRTSNAIGQLLPAESWPPGCDTPRLTTADDCDPTTPNGRPT